MNEKNNSGINGFDSAQPADSGIDTNQPQMNTFSESDADSKPASSDGSEYRYTGDSIVQDQAVQRTDQAQTDKAANNSCNPPYNTQGGYQPGGYNPQPGQAYYGNASYTYQNGYRAPQPPKPASFYNPYAQPAAPQPPASKPPKKKRQFGLGAMIACMLCTAIIGGGISAAATVKITENNSSRTPITNSGTTTINVEGDDVTLVEAVAEKVTPSVVGIRVTAKTAINPFFGSSSSSTSEGSGVIYTSDGYIVTNYHVISSAVSSRSDATVEVFLASDPETAVSATVVGYNSSADLAVLKVDKTGLPAIEIGDYDSVKLGQIAVAVGNPGGLSFMGSISVGYISGLNREVQVDSVKMTLIQTDASINPGNSGGALVNAEGKLIGIPNIKMADENFEGMGFAIPVNTMVEICNDIITNKDTPKPYIGVEISTRYTAEILKQMGYPAGALVAGVTTGGPAANAGLQQGDIITAVDGTSVSSYSELSAQINANSVGDVITLAVYRDGKSYDVKVTLGAANG